jgi:hypothetical protein
MRSRTLSLAAPILVASALLPCRAEPPFELQSGMAYGFRVDPQDEGGFGDPGWGLGGEGGWYFERLPRAFTLKAGAEYGNLEADDRSVLLPGEEVSVFLNTSHDYFRIFGGLDVGVHGRTPVQPHAAIHLALARQDVTVSRFDTTFGEFDQVETESDSGLGYDATVGLAFRVTRQFRLDAGVRYMQLPTVGVKDELGGSTRSDFALIYVGLGYGADP